MSADPHAVIRWGRASQRDYLLSRFFIFARDSGMCPDITEEEYGDICDYLESLLPGTAKISQWRVKTGRLAKMPLSFKQQDALFMIPRLTFKTSLIAALCAFAYLLDNGIAITLGRSTTTDAESTLDGIKTHFEGNQTLARAFGNLRDHFRVWTNEKITAANRPPGDREATIDTTGLNTSKTGFHPDLVILDDLVNETNYESAIEMEKAWKKIQAFNPVIERWGTTLVVGTRWGVYDVYGRIIKRDEQRVREGKQPIFRQFIEGAYCKGTQKVRFPTALPEHRIEELRIKTDPKLFASWIFNTARAEGEDIFTLNYIQYVDCEFAGGPYAELRLENTVENEAYIRRFGERVPLANYLYIDPAPSVDPPGMSPNRKRDFTGIVLVGFDPEANYWVLHAEEMKKMPTDRLNQILYLCRTFQPRVVRLENADLDAALMQRELDALGFGTKVISFDPRMDRRRILSDAKLAPRGFTKKAAQIEAMEPILRAGRVFFRRGHTGPLVQQLTDYPQVQHDDVLDAFSMSKGDEQRAAIEVVLDPEKLMVETERRAWAAVGKDLDEAMMPTPRSAGRAGAWAGPMTPVRRAPLPVNPARGTVAPAGTRSIP